GFVLHPSVLPDAPTPLEPQLLFLRGAAYLQHAVHLIESTVLKLEGVHKYSAYSTTASDGYGAGNGGNANGANANNGELRLSYLEGGLYGGVEVGNPEGPLGRRTGPKATAYRQAFGVADNGEGYGDNGDREKMREQITVLVKKSMRDHERFLSHFDSLDAGPCFSPGGGTKRGTWHKSNYDFAARTRSGQIPPPPTTFTTYHPLLVEAHFSILLCQLMLGDFTTLLSTFMHTAGVVDGLEGYPVFLPPRSMAQAEFIEVLERLAGGWRTGAGINVGGRGKEKEKERLLIEDRSDADNLEDSWHPRSSSGWPSPNMKDQGSSSSNTPSGSGLGSDPAHCDTPTNGISASTSSASTPSLTRSATPAAPSPHAQALNGARILLAPVLARQRARENERANLNSSKKNGKNGANKKPMSINIPLHGPRVDVILAWLGAVHLPALDAAA
ncbi:hypothetical protein B0H10DRAFT_2065227, partial [Mycena sp. CBHHK59/15]